MIRYDAIFYKKDLMVYISHLDLMTLIRRAIRRADLAYVLTEGFTPRVKISMPHALKLGHSSDSEKLVFWLKEEVASEEIQNRINKELPEGIRVTEVYRAEDR